MATATKRYQGHTVQVRQLPSDLRTPFIPRAGTSGDIEMRSPVAVAGGASAASAAKFMLHKSPSEPVLTDPILQPPSAPLPSRVSAPDLTIYEPQIRELLEQLNHVDDPSFDWSKLVRVLINLAEDCIFFKPVTPFIVEMITRYRESRHGNLDHITPEMRGATLRQHFLSEPPEISDETLTNEELLERLCGQLNFSHGAEVGMSVGYDITAGLYPLLLAFGAYSAPVGIAMAVTVLVIFPLVFGYGYEKHGGPLRDITPERFQTVIRDILRGKDDSGKPVSVASFNLASPHYVTTVVNTLKRLILYPRLDGTLSSDVESPRDHAACGVQALKHMAELEQLFDKYHDSKVSDCWTGLRVRWNIISALGELIESLPKTRQDIRLKALEILNRAAEEDGGLTRLYAVLTLHKIGAKRDDPWYHKLWKAPASAIVESIRSLSHTAGQVLSWAQIWAG